MATITNPLWNGVVPGGSNPTGSNINIGGTPNAPSTGVNSFLPQSGMSPSSPSSVSGNPFAAGAVPGAPSALSPSGVSAMADVAVPGASGPATPTAMTTPASPPVPGINSGGYSSSGSSLIPSTGTNATGSSASAPFGMSNLTPTQQSQMLSSLSKTYGAGIAGQIMQFLQSGAGYNQQAVNNMLASLQPGINMGEQNLMQQFSQSGNRFGSGAQLGLADYLSQVNLNEGQLQTQMYEQSLNDYMNVMMGAGSADASRISNSPSTWDEIMSGLTLGAAGASGA